MRCKQCDYSLWNLPSRTCPECGRPFAPSEYQFVPGSVRFCCPRCGQEYYGTTEAGHLDPIEFDCVRCGAHIHMDETVLRPGEGLRDDQTTIGRVPWLDRREVGFWRSWWRTVRLAMVAPGRMMRGAPAAGATGASAGFMLITQLIVYSVGALFGVFIQIAMFSLITTPGPGSLPPGGMLGLVIFGVVFGAAVTIIGVLAAVAVWAAVAHALLRVTGPTAHPIGRTFQSVCFASGANAIAVVPMCGPYIGWVWWVVSAAIAIKEAQRVSGIRAAFAAVAPPAALAVTCIGLYAVFISIAVSQAVTAARPAVGTGMETQSLCTAIQIHAMRAPDNTGPAHALQLIDGGLVEAMDFIDATSATLAEDVPVADGTLADYDAAGQTEQRRMLSAAIDALPDDVIAHRVGDFVFTYHGIDFSAGDQSLWTVIHWPDPDAGGTYAGPVEVGMVSGITRTFATPPEFSAALRQQNQLRQAGGLAPLPHPSTVTHSAPATAGSGG